MSVLGPARDEEDHPFAWVDQALRDTAGGAGAVTHRRGARVEVRSFTVLVVSVPVLLKESSGGQR